jgi:hypothetical protein
MLGGPLLAREPSTAPARADQQLRPSQVDETGRHDDIIRKLARCSSEMRVGPRGRLAADAAIRRRLEIRQRFACHGDGERPRRFDRAVVSFDIPDLRSRRRLSKAGVSYGQWKLLLV